MGQPKDEQPAPEMRCNATARYCVPKYDVASPWQLAISPGVESHT